MEWGGVCWICQRQPDAGAGVTSVGDTTSDKDLEERPLAAIERAVRVNRFMLRLIAEMVQFSADEVRFQQRESDIALSVQKGGVELKTTNLSLEWMTPLVEWCIERFDVLSVSNVGLEGVQFGHFDCKIACRVANQIVKVAALRHKAARSGESLALRLLESRPLLHVLEEVDISGHHRAAFDFIISSSMGSVLVGVPALAASKTSAALFLSLSGAVNAGQIDVLSYPRRLAELSREAFLMIPYVGDDVVDGLLQFRQRACEAREVGLAGIVMHGLVSRVCPGCAKASVVSPDLVKLLPAGLALPTESKYAVGRGCPRCDERGYSGQIGLQSVIRADAMLLDALRRGATQKELAREVIRRGAQPLLMDGLEKALAGKVTLESVFQLIRVVPDVYHSILFGGGETSVHVIDDAVLSRPSGVIREKAAGRAQPLLLVVEDDPDQRQILRMVFEAEGYEVVTACDGADGVEAARKNRPDLIVADLMMPKMDGKELLKAIRADANLGSTPVLILTVVNDVEREYSLLDAGADDYCEKTIQRRILLTRVKNLLRRSD